MCDGETSAKRMCDGETSAKKWEDNMAKMAKHQQTKEQNITPNNDIENQSRITNMCNDETSTSNKCVKAKHWQIR